MSVSRSPYTRLVSDVLFPLHERIKGHQSAALLRHLEATQWWSRDQLEAYRVECLRRVLSLAGAKVPYYRRVFREIGFEPAGIREIADLRRLPLSDKSILRSHFAELTAEDARGLVERRTTGSTGEPLTFLVSRERISFDVAAKWRGMRWWGVDIGDPEIVVWGSPIEIKVQDRFKKIRDRVLRSHLLPIIDISTAKLDEYLDTIRRVKPRMMFGYPSAIAQLARRAKTRGMTMSDLEIRAVFVTSEVLQPPWRQAITEAFGCPVVTEYGARDAGHMARECPDGSLHMTTEYLEIEVLDEQGLPAGHGQSGEVVVTNFESGAFPFLRYRTGDMATLQDRRCPCGRSLPLIGQISGRTNDCLVATDGRLVHDSALNYVIRALQGVQAYKIVQEQLTDIHVMIIPGPGFPGDAQQRIAERYRQLLGAEVEVRVERVADIPREASGKFRHVVTRVPRPAPDVAASRG
jgi:phenylacetate-CoA ligase